MPINLKEVIKILSILFMVLIAESAKAQLTLVTGKEKSAMIKMEEKKWSEARQILQSVIRKDSSSIEGLYGFAVYYSKRANPKFSPDTAKIFLQRTKKAFKNTDQKSREKLSRFPVTEVILNNLKSDIDSAAFQIAMQKNNLESLSHFIRTYPDAAQITGARLKRDSLTFSLASRKNTALAYSQYISQWPQSHLKSVAAEKFDELNFREKTASGSLKDYEIFYLKFPESKWRNMAMEKIFRLSTFDGQVDSFKNFYEKFPETDQALIAQKINRYRNADYGSGQWIPVANSKKIGFISFEGKILVAPAFDSLSYELACSEEQNGPIILPDGIYARTGKRLASGNFRSGKIVGSGFIFLTTTGGNNELVHESGWKPFGEGLSNATLIANRFLAIKEKGKWSLSGLNAQSILPNEYDSIFQIGSIAVFKKAGKFQLVPENEIIALANGKAAARVVEQIYPVGHDYIRIQLAGMEEILNLNLETVIPLDRHSVKLTPAGFVIEKNKNLRLTDWPALKNKTIRKIEFPEPWMKTVSEYGLGLYFLPDKSEAIENADSIWFNGRFAFARKQDSITLFTPLQQKVTFGREDEIKFLATPDSGLFFLVKKKTSLLLFDALSGKKIVTGAYTNINPVSKEYFTVLRKNKTGLINRRGKELLTADYDAMLYQNGWFSLLREKKFGGYHPASGKIIKPVYDAGLIPYSEDIILARKNKKWGIVDLKQKPEKTSFLFDEVKYVNDSLALVRKNQVWSMLKIYTGETIAEGIADWNPVENGERIIFKSGGLYGMISPSIGIIIKPRFTEIIWMSDDKRSLFIGLGPATNNMIPVEYFNRHGLILQKFITAETMLDLILCDN